MLQKGACHFSCTVTHFVQASYRGGGGGGRKEGRGVRGVRVRLRCAKKAVEED